MMRVAIVGSREYPDMKQVRDYVFSLPDGTEVVSGGARGVDTVAAEAAASSLLDLDVCVFPADWKRYGKSAGYRRNAEIVNYVKQDRYGRVVAFWDGKSSGTKHTIKLAREAGVPVTVFTPETKGE